MSSLQHKILHKTLLALVGPANARYSTLKSRRQRLEKVASWFRKPGDVRVVGEQIGQMPAEWLIPAHADPDRAMLYLHGGGYIMGSVRTHRHLAARLAKVTGIKTLNIDYRLAPEHPFPAALEDAQAGYGWLRSQGFAPEQILVAGDSAGGGLALALLVALRDAGELLPAAGICLSPWTDLAGTGASLQANAKVDPIVIPAALPMVANLYLAGADPKNPLASPLYADLHSLPPLLIQVGTNEGLLDDSLRFAQKARAAGVEVTLEVWDDMMHVWQFFAPYLPEANEALASIGGIVQSICALKKADEK